MTTENLPAVLSTATNEMTMSASTHWLTPTMDRASQLLAKSTMIPDMFKNNTGNCLIAIDIAQRIQVSPLTVMQNLYCVSGKIAWSGQFLIACINKSGLFQTPIRFKFSGKEGTDDYGCVAYVVDKNGETLESTKITVAMAKKEKWWSKKDKNGVEISKWQSMPQQMFQYRAAAFFARTYCPEITMGLMTQDEVIDIQPVPTVYTLTVSSVSETPVAVSEVESTPTPAPEATPPTTQDEVLDVESTPSTPPAPARNPMWDGKSAEFPPPEYDKETEVNYVKSLVDGGYFTMEDYKKAIRLYGANKVSALSDAAFESFVLHHCKLLKTVVDEAVKRNIPRAKLNEFARSNNEHSFLISSIETKETMLSLILEQTIPQQGNSSTPD